MDTRTGQIHDMLPDETRREMGARLGIPYRNLVRLTSHGLEGCPICKGTGIKRIMPHGRRIPCKCTGPQ